MPQLSRTMLTRFACCCHRGFSAVAVPEARTLAGRPKNAANNNFMVSRPPCTWPRALRGSFFINGDPPYHGTANPSRWQPRTASRLSCSLDRLDQLADRGLRIPIEHAGLVEHEQCVVDAGESLSLAALDDDDILGLVGIQDRHPIDRAALVVARIGIDDIVCADDERYIGCFEFRVDFVEVRYQVVRDAGFRQQHIHVARHASCDWVNGEAYFDTVVDEQLSELPHLVLRLGDRQAVTRNDDDFL